MGVSAVSDSTSLLIEQATSMAGGKVQQKISASVLKSVMEQQKSANDALLQMVRNSSSVTGTGKLVDIRV
jgi:hypothetical protein